MSPRDDLERPSGQYASASPEAAPSEGGRHLRLAERPPAPGRGRAWALAPFLILGGGLAGLGVMTALAVDDPSFALERDYYRKAVEIDARRAQEARNRELGWELILESIPETPSGGELIVMLLDGQRGVDGPALLDDARVTLEAFHNARALDIQELELEGVGEGRYRTRLTSVRPGLWELRFTVQRHGTVFTSVQRHVLGSKGKS